MSICPRPNIVVLAALLCSAMAFARTSQAQGPEVQTQAQNTARQRETGSSPYLRTMVVSDEPAIQILPTPAAQPRVVQLPVQRAAQQQTVQVVPTSAPQAVQTMTPQMVQVPAVRPGAVQPVEVVTASRAPAPTPAPIPASCSVSCYPPPSLLQRCKQGLQACFVGYGPEFESPALGSHVFQHNQTQVVNGEAALMMLHHFDFLQGSDGLTQRGKDQLAKIAEYLPRNFFPIVIERTPGTPELATARRQVVLNELAHGTFPVPPERVVIAASLAKGLKGAEAEIIYRNMMEQTRVSGVPIPPTGGTGGIGGTGGAARSAGTGTQGGAPGFP